MSKIVPQKIEGRHLSSTVLLKHLRLLAVFWEHFRWQRGRFTISAHDRSPSTLILYNRNSIFAGQTSPKKKLPARVDPIRGVRQSSSDRTGLVASLARFARNQAPPHTCSSTHYLYTTKLFFLLREYTTEPAGYLAPGPPCWPKTKDRSNWGQATLLLISYSLAIQGSLELLLRLKLHLGRFRSASLASRSNHTSVTSGNGMFWREKVQS